MKANESIRINLTIHPEKDPVLFNLLNAISNKDARPRRLINLATMGLIMESGNAPAIDKPTLLTNAVAIPVVNNSASLAEDSTGEKRNAGSELDDYEVEHFANFR